MTCTDDAMADIPVEVHADILKKIRNAREDVIALRKETNVVLEGYLGFDLAEAALAECHAGISGERDHARVVPMLRTAIAKLTALGGGDVAAARDSARNTLRALLQELEAWG
jgi:hypothetical protein